jgi:hypothetical protein
MPSGLPERSVAFSMSFTQSKGMPMQAWYLHQSMRTQVWELSRSCWCSCASWLGQWILRRQLHSVPYLTPNLVTAALIEVMRLDWREETVRWTWVSRSFSYKVSESLQALFLPFEGPAMW